MKYLTLFSIFVAHFNENKYINAYIFHTLLVYIIHRSIFTIEININFLEYEIYFSKSTFTFFYFNIHNIIKLLAVVNDDNNNNMYNIFGIPILK